MLYDIFSELLFYIGYNLFYSKDSIIFYYICWTMFKVYITKEICQESFSS